MGQWGVIVIALVSVALVVLQNDTVVVPLVVLGRSLPALPLGWWMAGAIALGWLTMLWLLLLSRAGRSGRSRRPEPWQRQNDPPSPLPSRRVARALDDEPPDDASADPSAYAAYASGDASNSASNPGPTDTDGRPIAPTAGRSPQRGWQDAPEDLADPATEFEQVVEDWDEPNRQDAGWRDDAAWDEWQTLAPSRRPRRDQRSPAANRDLGSPMDAQGDPRSTSRSEPQQASSPRDRAGFQPDAKPKIFEVPQTPIKQSQMGSIYSYRYRDDNDPDDPGGGSEGRPDLVPNSVADSTAADSTAADSTAADSAPALNRPTADAIRTDATAPRVILVPGATEEMPLDTVLDADSDAPATTPELATQAPPSQEAGPLGDRANFPPDRRATPDQPVPLDLPTDLPAPSPRGAQPAPPLNLPAPAASDRPSLNLATPSTARPPLTLGDRPGSDPGSDPGSGGEWDDEWDNLGDLAEDARTQLGTDRDADGDGSESLRSQLRRDRRPPPRSAPEAGAAESDEADGPDLSGRLRSWFQGQRRTQRQRNPSQDGDNRWTQTQDPTGDDWDDWETNPRPTPPEWEHDP